MLVTLKRPNSDSCLVKSFIDEIQRINIMLLAVRFAAFTVRSYYSYTFDEGLNILCFLLENYDLIRV